MVIYPGESLSLSQVHALRAKAPLPPQHAVGRPPDFASIS